MEVRCIAMPGALLRLLLRLPLLLLELLHPMLDVLVLLLVPLPLGTRTFRGYRRV